MTKKINTRLTVDTGKAYDADLNPIPKRFKSAVIGFYILSLTMVSVLVYSVVGIALANAKAMDLEAKDLGFNSKIKEIQILESSSKEQIKRAKDLINWQSDNVHGQKLIHSLLADLSKEVVLDRFSFKRETSSEQAHLIIDLQGGQYALHKEFEAISQKLESLGYSIISLEQSEISGGMRLKCLCQLDLTKKGFDEKLS